MEDDESSNGGGKYWYLQRQAAAVDDGFLLGDQEEEEVVMMMRSHADEKTAASSDQEDEGPRRRRESMVNKLISTVYSGPTISDIERALSFTGVGADDHPHHGVVNYSSSTSPAVVFSPEKVLSKMESKYTLKIKTNCSSSGGNNGGLAEDGYKWRKYGQKSIKNSPNPRSYYRCTNPRCNAKKQVERATDEPDTLVVTYEGLHLHYTYSHFLHHAAALPPNKKPKTQQDDIHQQQVINPPPPSLDTAGLGVAAGVTDGTVPAAAAAVEAWEYFDGGEDNNHEQQQQHVLVEEAEDNTNNGGGGLLEDVVPLLVRRPSPGETTTNNSSASSYSSCWTPTSPYNNIDMASIY